MAKTINVEKARQGRWGWQVLVVLAVALLLAMVAWFAAETFAETEITPQTQSEPGGISTTPNP